MSFVKMVSHGICFDCRGHACYGLASLHKTSETVLGGLIVVDHPVFFDTFVVSTVDDKTLRSLTACPCAEMLVCQGDWKTIGSVFEPMHSV